jgi:DNA polymerase-4
MSVWIARRRCPDLIMLPVPPTISNLSNQVKNLLQDFCPVVEPASVDEFYLDFTGCDRIYRNNLDIAEKIVLEIENKTGLPATMGIGTNKLVAKIASNLGKPSGILEILPGSQEAFLAPLPIKEIPGIGKKMEPILNSMEVFYVKDILALPKDAWRAAFGKTGEKIFDSARGVSENRVIAPQDKAIRKSISRDTTLGEDCSSRFMLLQHLSRQNEKAVYQMKQEALTCGTVTVKLRYSDFETKTKARTIPRTNDECEIFRIASNLFAELYSRRVKIRLIGVSLGSLQPGTSTPDLWDSIKPQYIRELPEVIKIIRAKYGFYSIIRTRSITRGKVG